MSFRLAIATLVLCTSTIFAMTCTEAVEKIGQWDTKCAKKCNEEGTDGLPKCNGTKERDPDSCGTAECENFLNSITPVDDLLQGVNTCTGDQSFYKDLFGDADFFKIMVFGTAKECGLADKVTVDFGPLETCLGGAYALIMKPDGACPKGCNEKGEDGLPKCQPGEDERTPESCGTAGCGNTMAAIDNAMFDKGIKGLAACASHDTFDVYATYAGDDGNMAKAMTRMIAESCGVLDRVSLAAPPLDSCVGGIMPMFTIDQKCPKKADDTRDSSSCGTLECKKELGYLKANVAELSTGMKKCKDVANMETYAEGADEVETQLKSITQECGFGYDDLPVPESAPASGAKSCQNFFGGVFASIVASFFVVGMNS